VYSQSSMRVTEPSSQASIYTDMFRGSAWSVLMRWSLRGIGLISTMILARLLTPEDFGIMAMASVVIGLLEMFSELGAGTLLIREANVTREDTDTAWTIRFLQSVCVALLLVLIAPFASSYFREPRVVLVMDALAFSELFSGATSIGIVLFRKELDFAGDFRFAIYRRLLKLAATVPLAFVMRSYWALVLGHLVSTVLSVLLSYRMHSYRPRFSLAKAREFLRFSASIVPLNIGRFLNERVDVLVVGRIGSTSALGVYNMAAELSLMATEQVRSAVERGLIPSYARLAYDREKLVEAFLHVLTSVSILTVPLALGLFSVSEDFVRVFLGSQWDATVPILRWLSIYSLLVSIEVILTGSILIASGHERLSAAAMWIRVGFLLPSVVVAGYFWGVQRVAVGATIAAALMLPVAAYCQTTALPVTVGNLARALWRPAVAGAIMALVVRGFHASTLRSSAVSLAIDVFTGAVTYATVLIFLWWLSGRPNGLERTVTSAAASRVRSWLSR